MIPFADQTWQKQNFLISTDPTKLDVAVIHRYLSDESYWAAGVSLVEVERRIHFSLCFGLYVCGETAVSQIGFARLISDYTSFAYLCDVFILPAYQGNELGQWLMQCILSHPECQNMRRWTLYTATAHKLYTRFGFQVEPNPEKFMVLRPMQPAQIS